MDKGALFQIEATPVWTQQLLLIILDPLPKHCPKTTTLCLKTLKKSKTHFS